jgi:hypothetical protein
MQEEIWCTRLPVMERRVWQVLLTPCPCSQANPPSVTTSLCASLSTARCKAYCSFLRAFFGLVTCLARTQVGPGSPRFISMALQEWLCTDCKWGWGTGWLWDTVFCSSSGDWDSPTHRSDLLGGAPCAHIPHCLVLLLGYFPNGLQVLVPLF